MGSKQYRYDINYKIKYYENTWNNLIYDITFVNDCINNFVQNYEQ